MFCAVYNCMFLCSFSFISVLVNLVLHSFIYSFNVNNNNSDLSANLQEQRTPSNTPMNNNPQQTLKSNLYTNLQPWSASKSTLLYSHAFVSSSTPASSPLSFPGCPHSPWVILSSLLSFFLTFSPYIFISLILPLVSPSSGILKPSLLSLLYIFLLSVLFTFPPTKSFCLLGRHIHSELSGLFLILQLAYILC